VVKCFFDLMIRTGIKVIGFPLFQIIIMFNLLSQKENNNHTSLKKIQSKTKCNKHTNSILIINMFMCTSFCRYVCVSTNHSFVIKLLCNSLDTMICMWLREKAIQKVSIFQSPCQKIVLSSEAI